MQKGWTTIAVRRETSELLGRLRVKKDSKEDVILRAIELAGLAAEA